MRSRSFICCVTVIVLGLAACSLTNEAEPTLTPTVDDAAINNAYYQCLVDAGVPAIISEDGAISYNAETDEQASLYEAADVACQEQIEAANPQIASNLDELNALYDQMTKVQECVAANGIAVGEWPSREVFLENNGDYSVPITLEPMTFEQLEELCPDEMAALP
ncbi:hypothetical protein [Trueperella bialowiezensis]|uniref:Lipoprotein n=1 Tax=Trueperella bialowiezensis TaxID=312285 RepID=A0A3S4V6F4_9ACTO|nr:hypothetical protein [Trueperella bialowiezensis]VEI13047.1 Uncharacterised protein [Trueperella bialowiezensis]